MIEVSNPNIFRENIKILFTKILNNDRYGTNIEKGIYNSSIIKANEKNIIKKWENPHFVNLYIDKFRTIYYNIKNEKVIEKILNKEIKSYNLACLTHQEILPDKWNKLIKELKIKNDNKYTPKIEASTDDYECYKCMSDEKTKALKENRLANREEYTQCTYYQLQTRSADEPMTTFITCIKCGTRWKR